MGNRVTELNPEIQMHFQTLFDFFCFGWDSLVLNSGRLWGPPSLLFSGYVLSLGLKQPGCEAHHLAESSAEVENEWSYSSTLLYAFIAYTGTLALLIVCRNEVCIGE
jgi:hypothetical protein